MWKVDIYLETDSCFQGRKERKCGYVLATNVDNEEKTKENFEISKGTYHQTILRTLVDALSRMTAPSEICVHTQDEYVSSRIPKLEEMAAKGWKEWERVYDLIHALPEQHEMSARTGKHSYSAWMQEEMKKWNCGEKDGA